MGVSAEVATLFLREMKARGVEVTIGADGNYAVRVGEQTLGINLENLSKDFASDRDPGRVTVFVDRILTPVTVPPWEEAESGLRLAAEPADYDFGDAVCTEVTDRLYRLLVYVPEDESRILWVQPWMLEGWGRGREEAEAVARRNLAGLVAQAELHVHETDGHRIGLFETDSGLKAYFLFAPNLRQLVEPALGWPVHMAIPRRDFAFAFPAGDPSVFETVGPVVLGAYRDGGYPISTEVYLVSDEGVEPVGRFEPGPEPPEGDEEGMKTVEYRGGVVRFRIPAWWEEEYGEDGGGTFYDGGEDTGTLRLNILTAESQDPVDSGTAVEMLHKFRQSPEIGDGAIEELPGGNAVLRCPPGEPAGEEDPMVAWTWLIANPVPPRHVRVAVFTYSVYPDQVDDPDVRAEVEMLDRELAAAAFAGEVGE